MNVLVVFTYNYSLNTWVDSGTFNKEIEIYKLLSEKGLTFTFLTFSEMDPKLKDLDDLNIKVIPVYKKIKRNNSRGKYTQFNKTKKFFRNKKKIY